MIKQVKVFYSGWGEHWLWGSLLLSQTPTGRPVISFEYSEEARQRKLELSEHLLPLSGPRVRQNFPMHQSGLPGPVYDALPDGWGMLLMDRLFQRQGLNPARINPLQRLACIGDQAMGAMSFEPVLEESELEAQNVSLLELSSQVQQVMQGEGGEFLLKLLKMGGSPQGARPKVLLFYDQHSKQFSTRQQADNQAWLVKFPAAREHAEVCAIEHIYSLCMQQCGVTTPESMYLPLPDGQAAFASKRFDREAGLRIPVQSLAAFTGADYRVPGSLDYGTFLRASRKCTRDERETLPVFERAVFNVIFNNRDDHPKNFSWLMQQNGQWRLAPAYDVTFCEGPGGFHQMDIMGEALDISRNALLRLGAAAGLDAVQAEQIIAQTCDVASGFSTLAAQQLPEHITPSTLAHIQQRIDANIRFAR